MQSTTARSRTLDPEHTDDLILARSAFVTQFKNRYSQPIPEQTQLAAAEGGGDEIDASINRDTGVITPDRASIFDYLFALGSIGTFIADVTTDILVAYQHFGDEKYVWFGLTVAFIVIPSILMQSFSCKWFRDDYLKQTWWTYLLHFLQLGTIER